MVFGVEGVMVVTVLMIDVMRKIFTRRVVVGNAIGSTADGGTTRCIGMILRATSSIFIKKAAAGNGNSFLLGGICTNGCLLTLSYIKCHARFVMLSKVGRGVGLKRVLLRSSTITVRNMAIDTSKRVDRSSHGLVFPSRQRVGISAGKIGLLRRVVLPHVRVGPVGGRVKILKKKRLRLHVGKTGTRIRRVGTLRPSSVVQVRCRSGPNLHCNGTRMILSCVIHHPRAKKGFKISLSRKVGTV